jgi:hypothetical protein
MSNDLGWMKIHPVCLPMISRNQEPWYTRLWGGSTTKTDSVVSYSWIAVTA